MRLYETTTGTVVPLRTRPRVTMYFVRDHPL